MKYIRTDVSGNKLRIYSKKGVKCSGPLEVVVVVKNLNEIKVSGAVNITSEGRINTGDFKFDFSGASKVDMDLSAANVITEAKGATELHLKGQAAAHRVNLSGVGKLYALDFVVADYRIKTSGASHCEINVLKNLEVNSKGASEVTYRGNPSSVVNHKSGASSIKKID
ncbi:GIN domain-containing protein [Mucilaginibacter lacusdianchii]|uniref:GIN domain-containing protein n=1 Tax=Mucilaginibacter lacusdianchii TaxID=2684211 RepID=UPI00131E2447|nr:DUF2807 domain-containing protein [Mucilaginibacter sp. JXJ CY 39]